MQEYVYMCPHSASSPSTHATYVDQVPHTHTWSEFSKQACSLVSSSDANGPLPNHYQAWYHEESSALEKEKSELLKKKTKFVYVANGNNRFLHNQVYFPNHPNQVCISNAVSM